jgi:phage shock protein PspC (stress-responsive transcriptional regulator)
LDNAAELVSRVTFEAQPFIPFAAGCAAPVSPVSTSGTPRLVRIPQHRVLGGVCAGASYFFGTPSWMCRAGFLVAVLAFGTGLVVYVILWALLPPATQVPADYAERTGG